MSTVDVLAQALEWYRAGQAVAVATVVETWGSAPRPVGSQLVVRDDGHMEGSVSGGCVEGAVIVEALEVMEDRAARLLSFGVSDDNAIAVGLACGGKIRVLVEPVADKGQGVLPLALLEQLVAATAARDPIAYVADLDSGARRLDGPADWPERFRLQRSGLEPDGRTFVTLHAPPLRMIVVGGVHIAQHLLPMARACGYDVTLVDPRPAFASFARFRDATLVEDWPDEALQAVGLDAHTAVVTLTHDAKLDDPAIEATLGSEAFYLGCLGSKRTHVKRLDRLHDRGFTPDQTARIHAPVGLDLGGRSPAEIAVSIMAEIVQTARRQGTAPA
ncbi:XdhC family protein [Thalassorhabdomicrobium marinisediminis]|uniref:XdhC family protein n=1 Tax=Thalassorhabdomicrobium marinisediminis TaxID=2170577 RepID=UPI00248FBEAF|nr:XdhC family protein [Thalassorhabdomicrobium marinisediminis]